MTTGPGDYILVDVKGDRAPDSVSYFSHANASKAASQRWAKGEEVYVIERTEYPDTIPCVLDGTRVEAQVGLPRQTWPSGGKIQHWDGIDYEILVGTQGEVFARPYQPKAAA